MAFNFKNTVDELVNKYKKQWQIADNVKSADSERIKKDSQNSAQKLYDELIKNGYGAVANNLKQRNYTDAKKYVNDYYTKTGRSQFRPYMYEKGKQFNLSSADIDKMISYDNDTGEVTFAGKNIGKPAGVVDGSSYFDASYLDDVWNNYVSESGISRTNEQLAGANSEDVRSKINKVFDIQAEDRDIMLGKTGKLEDYNYNHDPYSSSIGKSIMERFNYLGGIASGDAVADGAGTNGGNIDSFAAANAARQKLAFTTAGTEAVLNDFNSRIQNARGILSDLGVYLQNNQDNMDRTIQRQQNEAQRLEENAETKRLNDQAIENDKTNNLATAAGVTGYVPDEFIESNNPYLNKDGSLKDEGMDYNKRMTELENSLQNETDSDRKSAILWNLRWLEQARNVKTGLKQYSRFAGDRATMYNTPIETLESRSFDAQLKNALDLANVDNASDEKIAGIEADTRKEEAEIGAESDKYEIDQNVKLYENGYMGGNSEAVQENNEAALAEWDKWLIDEADKKARKSLKKGQTADEQTMAIAMDNVLRQSSPGYYTIVDEELKKTVATEIIKSEELTDSMKAELLKKYNMDEDLVEKIEAELGK